MLKGPDDPRQRWVMATICDTFDGSTDHPYVILEDSNPSSHFAQRDAWQGIAERLAPKPPEPKPEARRPWWRRLRMTG